MLRYYLPNAIALLLGVSQSHQLRLRYPDLGYLSLTYFTFNRLALDHFSSAHGPSIEV